MHCTIGFFGLNRSIDHTAPSIETNIYAPLENAGIKPTRVAHFNRPDKIHSPRSGEFNITMPFSDLAPLKLDFLSQEPQSDDSISDLMKLLGDAPWKNEADVGGHTRRNLLWQLHSLNQLYNVIRDVDKDKPADFYILLRPDLKYLDPLPVNGLLAAARRGVDLLTPQWATHHGLNDRLAVCSAKGLNAYCNRNALLPKMVREHGYIHPEMLLLNAAREAGLVLGPLPVRAARVRATGTVVNERFLYQRLRDRAVRMVRSVTGDPRLVRPTQGRSAYGRSAPGRG